MYIQVFSSQFCISGFGLCLFVLTEHAFARSRVEVAPAATQTERERERERDILFNNI